MVVDCGGGTVDITVYEMESSEGLLKELHKATGGPYGSLGKTKSNTLYVVYVIVEKMLSNRSKLI